MSHSYHLPSRQARPPSQDAHRRQRRTAITHYLISLDWWLIVAALGLSTIGGALIWSATYAKAVANETDTTGALKRHIIYVVVGLLLAFLASKLDFRLLKAYTPVVYLLSLVGLVLVFVPKIGVQQFGTRGWIGLPGGQTIQPSELAKLAVVLAVAFILSDKHDAEAEPGNRDVLKALLVTAVPMMLILPQPEVGGTLILGVTVLGMVSVSGAHMRWIGGLIGGAVLVAFLFIQFDIIKSYQLDRLLTFVDPEADPSGRGFNTQQARIAIGSGGWTGQGLFEGQQTQGRFVSVNDSDFVFSVAGEELGFVGAGIIIVLTGVILWRSVMIALRAQDMFGRLFATGIACWFTFQAFENIGMNLGIMPVTGVPLPFVSYGGTSMFVSWIVIGLLQSVHLRSVQ